MHKSRMEERLSFALNLILCDIATNFLFLGKKHDKMINCLAWCYFSSLWIFKNNIDS